jgi:outer membrane protein assembly factor BamB
LRSRKWATIGLLVAAALAGFAVAVALRARGGADVLGSSTVEFVPREPRDLPRTATQTAPAEWPTYGRSAARLRVDPGNPLRPPFRLTWTFAGRSLLEFPPALADGRLYVPTFAGRLVALEPATGRVLWRYASKRCTWGTPAVSGGIVYETFLLVSPKCDPGRDPRGELIAFGGTNGRIRWRVRLPATESSPLVLGKLVVVGDWSGAVTAFDAKTGTRRWRFVAGGAVKASIAAAGGSVYVGAYDGRLYALDARTGRLRWRAASRSFLGRHGAFYSTPAVAYNRVYVGSTDGSVYSFGAETGRLRWRRRTGGYVYSSPAVWRRRVFVGSYDGRLYALDAASGAIRWAFDAGGRISGSPSVIGNVVYVSTLGERTFALDAASGRKLWEFGDGKYSPAVADRTHLYLVGYERLFAFVPR